MIQLISLNMYSNICFCDWKQSIYL